jgi:phage terminase Nu1 subunit (DNA packaging protein)
MAKITRKQTERDVCDELDISGQTLKRYRSLGCPHTKSGRGKPCLYDVTEVSAWMRSEGLTGEMGRPTTERSKNQAEADLRKTNAMADNWEIRNARELRALLPVEEVTRAWSRVALQVRSRVLSVPDGAGPAMDGMDAAERIQEMKTRLEEALEQLDPEREPTTEGETSGD